MKYPIPRWLSSDGKGKADPRRRRPGMTALEGAGQHGGRVGAWRGWPPQWGRGRIDLGDAATIFCA